MWKKKSVQSARSLSAFCWQLRLSISASEVVRHKLTFKHTN